MGSPDPSKPKSRSISIEEGDEFQPELYMINQQPPNYNLKIGRKFVSLKI